MIATIIRQNKTFIRIKLGTILNKNTKPLQYLFYTVRGTGGVIPNFLKLEAEGREFANIFLNFSSRRGMRNMRNQIFHSPGNEEAELAKIPGDGDPPPPHWDLYPVLHLWVKYQKLSKVEII